MSQRRLACAALQIALACGLAGCASLSDTARVAPAISGELLGERGAFAGAAIERSVRHHDNPNLGASDAALVLADGRFEFPALNLQVTAQEFSKTYVLTLSIAATGEPRTLYREEYSRLAERARISLVCNLAAADALPCRVSP